jgi:hypothetical protein
MREQRFLNVLCFMFIIQPERACCTKFNTKAVELALMTGLTRSHIILFLMSSLMLLQKCSLLVFSEKFTEADRHHHLDLQTNESGGRVWEWGRLHYIPQGLLDKRCTSPRDQLAVVCTCQHIDTLHIWMFPNCN